MIITTEQQRLECLKLAADRASGTDMSAKEIVELAGAFLEFVSPSTRGRGFPVEPVEEFSVRVRNALKNEGVPIVGGMVDLSVVAMLGKAHWMRRSNMGRKSVKELEQVLASHGLEFAL